MMKKTVKYDIRMPHSIVEGHWAVVTPIDHPDTYRVSNKGPVITSKVVAVRDNGVFETLNTIYEPGVAHIHE